MTPTRRKKRLGQRRPRRVSSSVPSRALATSALAWPDDAHPRPAGRRCSYLPAPPRRPNDAIGDRQSETRAAGNPDRTVEPPKDRLTFLGRDAGSIVVDDDGCARLARLHVDDDGPTGLRVATGVVDNGGDESVDPVRRSSYRCTIAIGNVNGEIDLAASGDRLESCRTFGDGGGEVN